MLKRLTIVGAPTSAGAYGPGQEKTPAVFRHLGLTAQLRKRGVTVNDAGDVAGFVWEREAANPMNVASVAAVARAVSGKVASALEDGDIVLVLGGDCTVELGTVAGALAGSESVGLIYIDLDTDLNTPESTEDGVLDWMGVAHLLAVEGTVHELGSFGPRRPMLSPADILFFAPDNVKPFERRLIEVRQIANVPLQDVLKAPEQAAQRALEWAAPFDRILIHLDADVLDFDDAPLAENTRRGTGLPLATLERVLPVLLRTPNLAALTVTEINPDHSNETTLNRFVGVLAASLGRLAALS